MMNRSIIVARIAPASEREVAEIWAESDSTELPHIAGVRHRSLYRLDDLYVHLLETEKPGQAAISAASGHEEFARVSAQLGAYISPYLATWRGPDDARARCFYQWSPASAQRDASPR
jgi:cyclase